MINQICYIVTEETDPFKNLALEEYLFQRMKKGECILFLWQNEKTVVIGRNQNPWKECRVQELESAGGKLVRRLSGGGAVFHDLGNLNFTFLVQKEDYNIGKQLEVIVRAVNRLGIPAMKSGRNDITAEDRKFSGNAFYSEGNQSYHHGTILVQVDMKKLSRYLNVSREKLVSKGVESVRSRVVNLTEYVPELTIRRMEEELIHAFGEVYGLTPELMEQESIDQKELNRLEDKFSSWEWNFGRRIEFSDTIGKRFSWGDIELQMVVEGGTIRQCAVFSDSLETGLFERIEEKLTSCIFKAYRMGEALKELPVRDENQDILQDVISLIHESDI